MHLTTEKPQCERSIVFIEPFICSSAPDPTIGEIFAEMRKRAR